MARFTGRRSGNLPAETTSFVGRQDELAEIVRSCASAPLVTVTGVGGVGKTRTALRAAAELEDRFGHGVWTVDLSALREGALVGHAVARTLRVLDQTSRPQLDVLTDHLADRRLLLVLDTCEHLRDACAHLTEVLLAAAPGLCILATSRQPLGVPDERTVTIRPLATTDPDQPPVPGTAGTDRTAGADVMALFEQRASSVLPGFALTEGSRRAAIRICRRLEGIPLAVELAAGQLRGLSVEQLADRLDDRFQVLVGAQERSASRHQALRTTVGWSHELCTERERLLWARLAVFAGDFDLRAVQDVCADDNLPAAEIPRLVERLADKSILQRPDHAGDGARFRMLDTLRQYGAQWLDELGELESARQRHLDRYLRLAEWGEESWFGSDQAEVFTAIRTEHANLQAALESSLAVGARPRTALRLAASLWFYWVGCGFLSEGRHWLDRALALDSSESPERVKALWVAGYIAIKQGDTRGATALLEASRSMAARVGDRVGLANAVHRLGCVALVEDEHERAAPLFEEALERYDALGEMHAGVLMARVEYAMTIAFLGDLGAAVDMCERVRDLCERHRERWVRAYALYVLAYADWTKGDIERATARAREGMRISYAFHDLVCTVLPMELLALFQAATGHSELAARLQGAAQQIWRIVGLPLFGSAYFNGPHHECEERARRELGDAAFEACYHEGGRLNADQAVGLALGETAAGEPSWPARDFGGRA